MKRTLIIFAKEPKKGKVKTRLSSYLSQEGSLMLYKELLKNTVELARKVNCSKKIIAYESNGKDPSFLKKIAPDFEFHKQKGKDIGARMFNAFKAIFTSNTKAVIIGSDSPNLPKSYINKAFNQLSKHDLVLGPAFDGGYYLIGLKRPCQELFVDIEWSSSSVFKKTFKKAKKLNKKLAIINFWYDIDRPEDLKYLKTKSHD
jgi:hypothetical protein